jgi:hypothetical protein
LIDLVLSEVGKSAFQSCLVEQLIFEVPRYFGIAVRSEGCLEGPAKIRSLRQLPVESFRRGLHVAQSVLHATQSLIRQSLLYPKRVQFVLCPGQSPEISSSTTYVHEAVKMMTAIP